MLFFDKYNQFYSTSDTGADSLRLNSRYQAIIEENKGLFKNAKVLDIASHDGRWSFAALQAGAKHVKGIEPREELVTNARKTFETYNIGKDRFEFVVGDVFTEMGNEPFDLVLCLGFYYHTLRHAELLDLIERSGAQTIIIDTEITPNNSSFNPQLEKQDPRMIFDNPCSIEMLRDPISDQKMAYEDRLTRNGYTLVGRPSKAAIEFLAGHFGYQTDSFDWLGFFRQNEQVVSAMSDYKKQYRETFLLTKK